MPDINIYVRGDDNGNYSGMTREQILAAIAQAVSGGTIGDVDTGFVTTIKEQNKGQGLMFWVGTTAEFEALAEKPDNVLYIKTDDTSASDINGAIGALQTAVTALQEDVSGKAPTNHASSTDEYGRGTYNQFGHVMTTREYYSSHWNDSSTYQNKVVSGMDGKDFDTRIKQNAADIAKLYVPVHTVVFSTFVASASVMADEMGYGTWTLLKHDVITTEGGGSKDLFYWERTA